MKRVAVLLTAALVALPVPALAYDAPGPRWPGGVIRYHETLPRSWNASIPRSLEAITVKCMQKARERRYQCVDEVIADLDRFLGGEQIGAESSAWFSKLVGQEAGPPESSISEYSRTRSG